MLHIFKKQTIEVEAELREDDVLTAKTLDSLSFADGGGHQYQRLPFRQQAGGQEGSNRPEANPLF